MGIKARRFFLIAFVCEVFYRGWKKHEVSKDTFFYFGKVSEGKVDTFLF